MNVDLDNDPRRGLPSASGMERLVLCPGSWFAEYALPEDGPNEAAVSATPANKQLAALANLAFDNLPGVETVLCGIIQPLVSRELPRLVQYCRAEHSALSGYFDAAPVVTGWRPDSLERFFENLPDVLQHAANWCRADDRRQRKVAATARRRRAEDAAVGGVPCSEVERERALRLWRELNEADDDGEGGAV